MGVSEGGSRDPWILKIPAKKILFLISSGKKQISPLLPPPFEKFWKNALIPPPEKNPSDDHVIEYSSLFPDVDQ